MDKQITTENVFEVDVPKLALDSRFGSLVFDNASEKLSKAQKFLKEVHDLGYKEFLLANDAKLVDNLTRKLTELLEWVRKFDIGAVANVKAEHDTFNRNVDAFYDNVYTHVVMHLLPFLREERRRENPDQVRFDEEVKKVVQIRADLEEELAKVRAETEKIRTTGKEVGSAKGERAAVRLAVHFDDETKRYERLAKLWLYGVILGYAVVVVVLISLGALTFEYLDQIIALADKASTNAIWVAIVSKLVILAALWYGLSFVVKNYNVNSHLSAVNRHRAAVARTLEDFIVVEQQQEKPRLAEMLQNATDAMFKNVPIGYVSKTEKESGNPVLQIVNDLMGVKNNN